MKILLTGKNGQVGFALHKKLTSLGELIATDRETLDLRNPDTIQVFVDKTKPDIIINAASYTLVDQAEREPALAYKINTVAPKILADKAFELDIPIIHFSTDYVFDGFKKEPYTELDDANPLSIYGKTKFEGEELVRLNPKHIILRTGWIFGGEKNFLNTILNLAQEREFLNVVSDQWGIPTSTDILAYGVFKIIKHITTQSQSENFGTFHISCQGSTNWHDYACFILNEAIKLGFRVKLTRENIKKISSIEYASIAKRPLNSRLDSTKIKKTFLVDLPSWEEEVRKVLKNKIIQR